MKDTAMEYDEVAFYTVEYLAKHYPERLKERYQIDELPETDVELMEEIGRKRGALRAGARVDLHKPLKSYCMSCVKVYLDKSPWSAQK